MNDFHDVRFPVRLAFGARGGPRRQVAITSLSNGQEHRNSSQRFSRRVYDAGTALKSIADVYTLLNFFEARQGQLYAFKFRDPLDYKSSRIHAPITPLDQIIGYGDDVQTRFTLSKTYSDEAGDTFRWITKPISTSVLVAVDGLTTDSFDVDPLRGTIDFVVPPPMGAAITAGFEFDVPVRFDMAQLDISLDAFGAGEIQSIPLIEVLDHA